MRRGRHRAHRRRPEHRLPPRGGGGRQGLAASTGGRHSCHPSAVRPDRHRLRDQPRASAPQHGARAFPAVRPVRATADVRQPRRAGRRCAQRLRHRLDRADRDRAAHAGARRCALRRCDRPSARRPSRRGARGGPSLELPAGCAARASLLRHASRAGGRCGTHHPSDRRPGAQPGLPRCDGAGRPADRGVATAARTRARRTCCGATSGDGGRTIC